MDPKIGEQVRAKVREALAAQPFRDMPHFDDVVEAAATAALHIAHVLSTGGGGDLPKRIANLETQADAAEDAVKDLTNRVVALEAIGASVRQASAASPAPKAAEAKAVEDPKASDDGKKAASKKD